MMSDQRVFIINVGANAASGTLRSPIFEDGSFFFVPIEETGWRFRFLSRGIPRYRDILPDALPYLPERFHKAKCHNDPEFATCTYGDWPGGPRASALKQIAEGDHLLFLARLVRCDRGRSKISWGPPGFFVVGRFIVAEVVRNVTRDTPKSVLQRISGNAHVHRMACILGEKNFWVVRGGPGSGLLRTAMPFDRELVDRAMTDKNGEPYRWDEGKSDLQVIGSYTRSCRMVSDPARVAILLGEIQKHAR